MIQRVTKSEFIQAFEDYHRQDKFSYEGLSALYDYLEDAYEGMDSEYELDVIAICSEFTEYEDMKELQSNYTEIKDMDDLTDHTSVIDIDGTDRFIIADF